jgi:hypothetical protein
MKRVLCCLSLLVLWPASAAFGQDDVVMKAMRDELSRSTTQLHLANLDKPYFIAYRVDDTVHTKVSATLGQVTDEDADRSRNLEVQVRVGNFDLDNKNFMGGEGGACGCHTTLPLDDDYDQIRHEIWLQTDAEYKAAASDLAAKRSILQHRQHGQELPDFLAQPPATQLQKPIALNPDVPALEKLARELSSAFRGSPEFLSSGVDIYVVTRYTRFLNSEGTSFTRAQPIVVLDVRASTQAEDGRPQTDGFRVYGRSLDVLRTTELLARTRELVAGMKALRTAKSLDHYNGPVLFEGEAAGEVVAQVFAPAVVTLRIPIAGDPQFETQVRQVMSQFGTSLADRIGARVMPDGFDLTDNPQLDHFGDSPLMGTRGIDDEGVPSREVAIVQNGRLKTLLASRTPTAEIKASTGSDSEVGPAPSNLLLTERNAESNAEVRKELVRTAQQRGYDYGVVIRHVSPGLLNALMRMSMARGRPDASSEVAAYKVFADGHEELVRADIEPIPMAAFKDLVAADDKPTVYHDVFMPFGSMMAHGDAENRQPVVVSYVVPALLFDEGALKQPAEPAPKPPLIPSPMLAAK